VQVSHAAGWWVGVAKCVRRKGEPLTDDTPPVKWDGIAGFDVTAAPEPYMQAPKLPLGTQMEVRYI